jgi:rhodanese-related sulfurtransferase
MHEPTPEQIEQIAKAIANNKKIEAIRLYRSFTGSDLMKSKDFIEKLTVKLREADPARFPAKTGKGCMSVLAVFGTVAGLVVALGLLSCRSIGWTVVDRQIRYKFPAVKRIQTNELAQWLNDKHKPQPVLLDVRTIPEFAFSHIPHARRIEPGANPRPLDLPKDQPIVTYCSVGYRSAQLAQRLGEAGFDDVFNLEGSIFKWANEDRPLVRGAQRVIKVHPYDQTWGLLLKKSVRADVRHE